MINLILSAALLATPTPVVEIAPAQMQSAAPLEWFVWAGGATIRN